MVTLLFDPKTLEWFVMRHSKTERRVLARMPTWRDALAVAQVFCRQLNLPLDTAICGRHATVLARR